MEEKKIKFELSMVALVFVVLFGLCILIWTFILGVWIGTKIGGKTSSEEVALEKKPEIPPISVPLGANETNATNQTAKPTNETISNQTETVITKIDNATKEVKKEEIAKRETPVKTAKETPEYKKKEVAQLATKIKEEPMGKYSIQVGAFSQRDKAEQMKNKIKNLGYTGEIKEVQQEGKTLFKVYLGKFGSREEAEKVIPIAREKLGVDKPFVVEIR
ncbi:MAG: SPOR domain-containing protein [Caldimicrobium sp.]|nr:SPOR domain-containing protein [Caldimicrobium sp.]MCX7874220.1 SPOR domain-containing protein [Caldimicrobium sp.]MDW8094624.1 SPOR domain-containing protein [Caldimicrobium sp.]